MSYIRTAVDEAKKFLTEKVVPEILGAWDNIKQGAEKAADYFVTKMLPDIKEMLGELEKVFNKGKEALQAAWEAAEPIVSAVWAAICVIIDAVEPYIAKEWNKVKKRFDLAFKIIGKLFTVWWKGFKKEWSLGIDFIVGILGTLKGVFSAVAALLHGDFAGAWEAIKGIFGEWDGFFLQLGEMASNLFGAVGGFIMGAVSDVWEWIKGKIEPVAEWINEHIIEPIKNYFSPLVSWLSELFGSIAEYLGSVFDVSIQLAAGCWKSIKAIWGVASKWFNSHIIAPVKALFIGLWSVVRTKASAAWNFISGVWNVVSSWFNNTVVEPVGSTFSELWDGLKTGASAAWDGIKSVFEHVVDWFEEKFSTAWAVVKGVFSAGGDVFEGIKHGIADTFRETVNFLIDGINDVVAEPFEHINDMLEKISKVEIGGFKPFSGLTSRISIPVIPHLAKGGVLGRGQVGLLEGDGAEAVVPLEKNKGWIRRVASELSGHITGIAKKASTALPAIPSKTINYTQNNYSPKALTRAEIYRQTHNLLGLAKGAM